MMNSSPPQRPSVSVVRKCWRKVPVTKTLVLLKDGKTVDKAEIADLYDEMQAAGMIVRERECHGKKVISSLVTGKE